MEDKENQDQIDLAVVAERLVDAGFKNVCPMCLAKSFQLQPGIFVNILQNSPKNIKLDGPSIPVAVVICTNCGLVLQYSLGRLGLLTEDSSEE